MKTKTKKAKEIRLASTSLVHAPGIIAWAINGAKFKRDRVKMRNVMKSWPADLTDEQWDDVLSGKIPHKIDGNTVIITV
jgi:hypothetical protein